MPTTTEKERHDLILWQCEMCGMQTITDNIMPLPQAYGKCPKSTSGNHVLEKNRAVKNSNFFPCSSFIRWIAVIP